MDKPYIQLDTDFSGIVQLFMYDHEVASKLTALGQTIMRRKGSLSIAERELIGAFVSKLNDCQFCCDSHAACAMAMAEQRGGPTDRYIDGEMVDQVIYDHNTEVLSIQMRALLCVAACVQSLDREQLPKCIAEAKAFRISDEEIHDTVLIASFFSMCNRYVDSLGTTFKPGEPEQGGLGLAKYGYTMGIGRFFREVLPKFWAKLSR